MRKTSDLQLQKVLYISIFIFLFGLFSGVFFSTGLSEENNSYLSDMFISSLSDPSRSFFRTLLSSLVSNLTLALFMLAAVLSRLLRFLPFAALWFKSFASGFCSSLLYLSETENAVLISLVKLLPPSLFVLPGFIVLAAVTFIYSRNETVKAKRPSREKKGLQNTAFISLAAIAVGCIINAIVL